MAEIETFNCVVIEEKSVVGFCNWGETIAFGRKLSCWEIRKREAKISLREQKDADAMFVPNQLLN